MTKQEVRDNPRFFQAFGDLLLHCWTTGELDLGYAEFGSDEDLNYYKAMVEHYGEVIQASCDGMGNDTFEEFIAKAIVSNHNI